MLLLELLTLVFIVLKLTKVISWSWWLVFLPLIISCAFGFYFGFINGFQQGYAGTRGCIFLITGV